MLSRISALLAVLPVVGLGAAGDEHWDGLFGIPGADGPIWSIAVHERDVYVGGSFTQIGGVSAGNAAKWDGTNWGPLGAGLIGGALPEIHALALAGEDLYAGGYFTQAGSTATCGIARWDGTNWNAVGGGVSGGVRALVVVDSSLFVGGTFSSAGALTVNNVAKWDGTRWSGLSSGADGEAVDSLAASGTNLYVGGRFTRVGSVSATNIAKWDGTRWSALGGGLRYYDGAGPDGSMVRALLASGSELYAGGDFVLAGTCRATNIARWDGENWWPVGGGIDMAGAVYAVAAAGRDLYIGGYFRFAGDLAANHIAKWDGAFWSGLGTGLQGEHGSASAIALASNGSDLLVGGFLQTAGGIPSTNIALWHIPHALAIRSAGEAARVSWPATGTNFVLEAKGGVADVGWSEVAQPRIMTNDECVVTDPLSSSNRIYRLRRR
jgi:hypothetical protein